MKNNEYLIIPKQVFENRELSSSAKILYGLIMLYSRREGYCWASNSYLSMSCGCSPRNITRLISELEKQNFIRSEEASDGKHMKRRRLYITDLCDDEDKNVDRVSTKSSMEYGQKCPDGVDKNGAYINNKYINKNYNYKYNYAQNKNTNYWECESLRDDNVDYDELERLMQERMDK